MDRGWDAADFGVRWLDTAFAFARPGCVSRSKAVSSHRTPKSAASQDRAGKILAAREDSDGLQYMEHKT